MTTKPTAVIVDVDGTLCDTRTIEFHFEDPAVPRSEALRRFHHAALDCPPNLAALNYALDAYRSGHTVLIMTGREQLYADITTQWLDRNLLVPYEGPVMRMNGDRRRAADAKKFMLSVVRKHFTVVGAIDDDRTVVDMFHEHGIPTVHMTHPLEPTA